ncbi:MAG: recombination-associated protein RdgC, partial [Desulfovibrio sp.]|nr:recombination-associated protein RdgC [Desulfovibrio sp.]
SNTSLTVFQADQAAFSAEKLRKHAFVPEIDEGNQRMGWVGFEDLLDYSLFDLATPVDGFVGFSFRLDVKRAPSAVVKLKLAEAIQKEEEKKGGHISKARKKELKEEITADLTKKADYQPALTDVIWDLEKSLVYVSTQSGKVLELLCELFTTTFGSPITQLVPEEEMSNVLMRVHRDSLQCGGYTLSSLGSASLVTDESAEEHAQVTVQNDINAVKAALDDGLLPNKLHILAVLDADENEQFDFELSNTLAVSKLRMPKPEKGAHLDALFLVNAAICSKIADLLRALAKQEG